MSAVESEEFKDHWVLERGTEAVAVARLERRGRLRSRWWVMVEGPEDWLPNLGMGPLRSRALARSYVEDVLPGLLARALDRLDA